MFGSRDARVSNQAEITETSQSFGEKSQFQSVIGAIDGCHIQIKAPKQNHQLFITRKKFYSIVVLTCCNSKMDFTYFWAGNPDSTHDATVLRMSDLYQFSDFKIHIGYCILRNSTFPLMQWCITPYRDFHKLTQQQNNFNTVHSQCRQVIKC